MECCCGGLPVSLYGVFLLSGCLYWSARCAEGPGLGCQVTHLHTRSQTTRQAQSSQPHRGIVGRKHVAAQRSDEYCVLRGGSLAGL
ncbi:hypothetical protein SKAU_G00122170 [Synaphobranchus kaupii]|uniref:Secreted protein n=1 Tax=Synaphobranchus kaupii TaxID=118154 RepID=A0A9Q1FNR0_SYNKA|nr:hypothetical protein SKAU_G00122170 [Synaphobranchus kaupii]